MALDCCRRVLLGAATALLAGCAGLGQQPSNDTPNLTRPLSALRVPAQRFGRQGLKPCPFNPDKGLDGTGVAILSILNNPQLGMERGSAKVGAVQLFDAGLLPVPSLERNPRSALAQALVARVRDRLAGGSGTHATVHLTLLWDEWQVAQTARLLYARRLTQQRIMAVLHGFDRLFRAQQRRAQADGSGAADTMLAARMDLRRRMAALRGESRRARRTLNAVLGLGPHPDVLLAAGGGPPALAPARVSALLETLGQRRPDLVALEVAGHSGGRRLREAVLARFHPIRVALLNAPGAAGATTAPVLDVQMPFFDDSLGRVDPALATREYLRSQRQGRIARDKSLVKALQRRYGHAWRQLNARSATLARLQKSVERARDAYQAGHLPGVALLALEQTLLSHQLAWLQARYLALQLHIAIQSLLFAPGGS